MIIALLSVLTIISATAEVSCGDQVSDSTSATELSNTYEHVATSSILEVSLCGSSFDTNLVIKNSNGIQVHANDDHNGWCAPDALGVHFFSSHIKAYDLSVGETYTIDVTGYESLVEPGVFAFGAYDMSVACGSTRDECWSWDEPVVGNTRLYAEKCYHGRTVDQCKQLCIDTPSCLSVNIRNHDKACCWDDGKISDGSRINGNQAHWTHYDCVANGRRELSDKIGRRELSDKIGRRELSDKIGRRELSDKIGRRELSDEIGRRQLSDEIGRRQLSDKIGRRELSDKIGRRELSDEIGRRQLSDRIGRL